MGYKINPTPPWDPGDKPKYETLLDFQYSLDENNDYVFDYRSVTTTRGQEALLPVDIEKVPWTRFFGGDIGKVMLDIDIKGRTQVMVRTVDSVKYKDLFFSPTKTAILTREPRQHLYGHLEYLEELGGQSTSGPRENCRVIKFKAIRNGDWNDTEHKFDYYVYLPDLAGGMKELRIDPDIKNPSS